MRCNTYRFFNIFNNTVVTTVEPENIQAVLATKFNDFDLGAERQNFHDVIGNGIFTSDGAAWSHYRHQLRPQFTRDQINGDIETADRHLQVLYKSLPEENALGWIDDVDVKPLLYRFTMDVSTEFLFGESVNSQSRSLYHHDSGNTSDMKEDMDFADAMNFAQNYIVWRFRLGSLYWLARSKKFMTACQIIKDFAGRFVRLALDPDQNRLSAGTQDRKKKFVLLQELVEETRDPVELRDQILHVLLAGRDTTAALISWTLFLLSRYPNEFRKLREAVISQFGTEAEPTSEMTFSSLKACKEITYFIYETLRLYPLVPMNSRTAIRDTVLPVGGGPGGKQPIAIRKGERVAYIIYVMHRRKDIWGEDADEFIPARWEGRRLGWDFIPFSGGPRICLGRRCTFLRSVRAVLTKKNRTIRAERDVLRHGKVLATI
jgi:cytochrome P450